MDGHIPGTSYDFSQETYNNTPGASISQNLDNAHDAATVELGEGCKTPSSENYIELNNNTTHEWVNVEGVWGWRMTSKINGRSIFLPANGHYEGTDLLQRGSSGRYWATNFETAVRSFCLGFSNSVINPQGRVERAYGLCIRPIKVL